MSHKRVLAVVSAVTLATWVAGCTQRTQEQPSITFGTARISLGMTAGQVEQHLSEAARHADFTNLSDKNTAAVMRNGELYDLDGTITFRDSRVVAAQILMPNANSAEELAEQVANAVDNMEIKSCTAANIRSHTFSPGVGDAVWLQTRFVCGTRKFDLMTMKMSVSNIQKTTTSISIGIGETPSKSTGEQKR